MNADDRHWAAIGETLEHCWPDTPFNDATEGAYRAGLGSFPASVVGHAVQNIVARGVPRDAHPLDRKRRPTAPEIAEECRIIMRLDESGQAQVPAFVEIERVVCNEAWDRDKNNGARIVLEKCGPLVADWFTASGYSLIRSLTLGDDPGGFKRKQVAASYGEYVAAKVDRNDRQLPYATNQALNR